MKILLYYYDKDFARSLKEALGNRYELIETDSYYTAKEHIIRNNFNLIISEIKDKDDTSFGIELLKILKASAIEIPVIIIALKSQVSIAVECLKLGAIDFIEKSAVNEPIIERIRNAIEKAAESAPRPKQDNCPDETNLNILFVDDNIEFTKSVKFYFAKKYNIDVFDDFVLARDIVAQKKYDCIFLDIKDEIHNDERAGVKLLKTIMDADQEIPVIMLSGWADTSLAVECLKLGAKDFLEKSLKIFETIDKIDSTIKRLFSPDERENKDNNKNLNRPRYRVIDIIGECAAIKNIRREIIEVANHDVPVLVFGQTGTGKEMVASSIHIASGRRDNPFVEVDCGSIPESIFESELFGYMKGAFTGAGQNRKGKMESAHKGTLFMDEIENITLEQQSKLLRILENKKIYPLGSNEGKIADFRLICASNVDLHKMVEEGKFREDLFYRLNVYHIDLPPLQERGEEDISLLINYFLSETGNFKIEKDALELLKKYSWPGNARELKNLLKKFEIITSHNSRDNTITFEIVKEGFRKFKSKDKLTEILSYLFEYYNGNIPGVLKDLEDFVVTKMHKEFNGNISKIAQRVYQEGAEDNRNHREKVRKVIERNRHLVSESFE